LGFAISKYNRLDFRSTISKYNRLDFRSTISKYNRLGFAISKYNRLGFAISKYNRLDSRSTTDPRLLDSGSLLLGSANSLNDFSC
jgi:hypothetical protein